MTYMLHGCQSCMRQRSHRHAGKRRATEDVRLPQLPQRNHRFVACTRVPQSGVGGMSAKQRGVPGRASRTPHHKLRGRSAERIRMHGASLRCVRDSQC